eukprot:1178391-Prorocentrum_minimum.AAC.1
MKGSSSNNTNEATTTPAKSGWGLTSEVDPKCASRDPPPEPEPDPDAVPEPEKAPAAKEPAKKDPPKKDDKPKSPREVGGEEEDPTADWIPQILGEARLDLSAFLDGKVSLFIKSSIYLLSILVTVLGEVHPTTFRAAILYSLTVKCVRPACETCFCQTRIVSTAVDFLIQPKMWSEKGHFLPLAEQKVPSVGTAYIKVFLHDKPAPPPPPPEEEAQQ